MAAESNESQVTLVLHAAAEGDEHAAAQLMPLVYQELRNLAHAQMRKMLPGNTLQTTALVHEAYLRLVGDADPGWKGRGHFFGAAASAMRNILVDQARRNAAIKHGGDRRRVGLHDDDFVFEEPREDVLALDEALSRLEADDPRKGRIVMLRYFAGLSEAETAAVLDISERTVRREWRYVKAWLREELEGGPESEHTHA